MFRSSQKYRNKIEQWNSSCFLINDHTDGPLLSGVQWVQAPQTCGTERNEEFHVRFCLASAWYPKEKARELHISEELNDNPIVWIAPARTDSRPAARAEVEETLNLPTISRMKSLVKGPLREAPQDESDDSDVVERRAQSKRRRTEALTSLREHAKKGVKGQKTLSAVIAREVNAFQVNRQETAKDMNKESLRALQRHASRSASKRNFIKTAAKVAGAVGSAASAVGSVAGAVGGAVGSVAGHVGGAVKDAAGHIADAVGNYLAPAPVPARGRSRTSRAPKVVAPAPVPAPVLAPEPDVAIPVAVHPREAYHRGEATKRGIDHTKMVFNANGEPHAARQ